MKTQFQLQFCTSFLILFLTQTALALGPDLVVNGNFESGNIGFISDYNYCNVQDCMGQGGPSDYAIGSDPTFYHGAFQGSGNGNFMIVDGAPMATSRIWSETLTVDTNTDYAFVFWLSTMDLTGDQLANIRVTVNGVVLGSSLTAPGTTYTWVQFNETWNSEGATQAVICLYDLNIAGGGNDFGLDDISFRSVATPCDFFNVTAINYAADFNCSATAQFSIDSSFVSLFVNGMQWSASSGLTIVSGQGTPQCTIVFSLQALSDNIPDTISFEFAVCGIDPGLILILNPHVQIPLQPGTISGPKRVCPGDHSTYSVAPMLDACTYSWTTPIGGNITSGQGTSSIDVFFTSGFSGGNISVVGQNIMGAGSSRSKTLSLNSGCIIVDADGDGYNNTVDCNDANPAIHPGATEICNGIDDNCDGQIDEGVTQTFYADADMDGYGNPNSTAQACSQPTGYVINNTDCNDANPNIHPGAVEMCNGIDDNCNSQTDEGGICNADNDHDNYTIAQGDCDDANASIHPGAMEVCNGLDDNCNGQIDEGVKLTFYLDKDGDGFGDASDSTLACDPPPGYVANNIDCNDNDPLIHPLNNGASSKQWDLRFGGSSEETLQSLQQTSDGGYILGGMSKSNAGGDKSQNSQGGDDYWMVKTDGSGVKQWDVRFGSNVDDELYSIQQTNDGGYILGGVTSAGISGDKTQDSQGGLDYWVVKTDASGVKQWDKRFGGSSDDILSAVRQTSDGGYILGGYSSSGISGDKTQVSQGLTDYWIVKIDASGIKTWDKTFGGNNADALHDIQQAADGGYILAGNSLSDAGGDKSQPSQGSYDYWIVKTDAGGVKQWDTRFGGSSTDLLNTVRQTTDGGYILGGYSNSDISGDKTQASQGDYDYWIVKINESGGKVWDARFGGNDHDYFASLEPTVDGGYILGGYSLSGISGDKTQASQGQEDFWVVKTDANGSKQWDLRFGGDNNDELYSLQQTLDDGYILGGYSTSGISGDKTQASQGAGDYWVVKLTSDRYQVFYQDADGDGYGNPSISIFAPSCSSPSGYVLDHSDCNDAKASIHPGVSDICNSIDDNCNGVIDENAITATITPSGTVNVCSGTTVILAANSGSGITYQWLKNNKNISGATTSSYSTNKAAGYSVKESNTFSCNSTSATTTLNENALPTATITPLGNLDICHTGSVVLQANAGTGLTYQWKKGSANISGATKQTYTAIKAATYKVVVTNSNGCSKTSAGTKVTKSCREENEAPGVTSAAQLSLYPNPTDGKFMIDLNTGNESLAEAKVQVVNLLGQIIYNENIAISNGELKKEISLEPSAASGIYLVRVIVNGEEFTNRILYQK